MLSTCVSATDPHLGFKFMFVSGESSKEAPVTCKADTLGNCPLEPSLKGGKNMAQL